MNSENADQRLNVVITGASKGMGKAIAEKFAAARHNLFLCARNQAELEHTAGEIAGKHKGIYVHHEAVDLSIKEEAIRFGVLVAEKMASIDILINNAGQFMPGSVHNEEDGTLEKMMGINVFAAYHLTRKLLPGMMKKRSGHIINICSIAALKAYSNGGSYSISKFAMMGFSRNLREEMKPFNIKVTTIFPGAVYTSSWEGSDVKESRIMEVNDIADTVFLATSLSPQACIEDIVLRPQLGDI